MSTTNELGIDPHDEPHVIVEAHPIGAGFAVIFERSVSRRHARLCLIAGEGGPSEELSCLVSDGPIDSEWGFVGEEAAWVAGHVGWHIATGTPPGCDQTGEWDCPCDD